ncbi:MAG: GIY-YIG nuclease family protein [Planctomycetota bacterium]
MPTWRLTFRELLEKCRLNVDAVLVMRHTPKERQFAKAFPQIAENDPDAYNAYQRTHFIKQQKQLATAEYLASFIGHKPNEAVFIGLYAVGETQAFARLSSKTKEAFDRLVEYGGNGCEDSDLVFDLRRSEVLDEYSGRLAVSWSGGAHGARSWSRWASSLSSNGFPVTELQSASILDQAAPIMDWRSCIFSWAELRVIPERWQITLSQWRGIYFILDTLDGAGYVGSAYGTDNIWGRWKCYAETGHGGNRLLFNRDARNFRFSILQRLDPDLPPSEVIDLENNWKDRLHTRDFGLNKN